MRHSAEEYDFIPGLYEKVGEALEKHRMVLLFVKEPPEK
jgi:hypothetical protein